VQGGGVDAVGDVGVVGQVVLVGQQVRGRHFRLQAQWTAFNGRYGPVALLYLQNRRRPERRVLESEYAKGVLRGQYRR
jgi:hypothetical protein